MIGLIRCVLGLAQCRLEVQLIILRKRGLDHCQFMEEKPIAEIKDQ